MDLKTLRMIENASADIRRKYPYASMITISFEFHTFNSGMIHHIEPVHRGGRTADENLLALCLPCHTGIDDVPQAQQLAMKGSVQ